MEHPDVEIAGDGGWIAGGEILGYRSLGEALSVNGHSQLFQERRLGLFVVEGKNAGEGDFAGNQTRRIVISLDKKDWNVSPLQSSHLLGEEPAGSHRFPVAVVDIPGNQEKVDLLIDTKADQLPKSDASGVPKGFNGSIRERLEPEHGAVEMKVGGMDEFEVLVHGILWP